MHKFSCYETLAQLIDICKTVFFLIAFHYLTDFRNIVLKIIFPILIRQQLNKRKDNSFGANFGEVLFGQTLYLQYKYSYNYRFS